MRKASPKTKTLNLSVSGRVSSLYLGLLILHFSKTMAFYSMLRRASSSVLPLSIRTFRSSRNFHGAAFTVLSTEKRNLSRELTRRSRVPILQFSTETAAAKRSAEENLISILESEIQDVDSNDTVSC